MFDIFKNFMQSIGRHRVIYDRQDNEPYLERYYLFLKDRVNFPFNVFLHKFYKSDPDDLHDHPWNYITFIVKGGYWEYTPNGKFWRGPGHFRRCTAESYHRIEIEPGVACWSIFIPGKQRREWGFDKNGTWIQHEKYLKARKEEQHA